ncbi:MAG: hypothetical protein ABI772_07090 [Bacteroidota bacterium]
MSCCGQKRQQWQQNNLIEEIIPVSLEPVLENPVLIQYSGPASKMIKGNVTGYIYLFAADDDGLQVDGSDVALMLNESVELSPVL